MFGGVLLDLSSSYPSRQGLALNLEPTSLALETHRLLSARMSGSNHSCVDFRWDLGTQILAITLMWQTFLSAEPFPQPGRDTFLNASIWHAK